MAPVATASAIPAHSVSTAPVATRPNMVQVGTIVWLASELMFFAGLFAVYFQLRSVSSEMWAEETAKLNVPFAFANTLILVISSVWCQLGVWKAERGQPGRTGRLLEIGKWGMREWYVLTFLLGAVFVSGQVYEYAELVHEGLTLASSPFGSTFYLTTGFHGLHVIGGLVAFIFVLLRSTVGRYTPEKATSAIVVSYYWHFVDVVWIGLFATVYLIK